MLAGLLVLMFALIIALTFSLVLALKPTLAEDITFRHDFTVTYLSIIQPRHRDVNSFITT